MGRSPGLALRRVRQTFSFANGGRVLLDLASSRAPWRRDELVFETRDGAVITCPNWPGARVPVYEVFAEDAYHLRDTLAGLSPTPRILDIGGQVGCFSVAAARFAPTAVVHTYEASATTATWLARNVARNDLADRVTVNATAVAGHDGTLELVDNGHASGLNGGATAGTLVTVPCVTFAAALTRLLELPVDGAPSDTVDLVKLDTEGAEFDIVLSSEPADWAPVRRVVMEYHDVAGHSWSELEAFFAEAGLTVTRHEPNGDRYGTVWLAR
ncbi:FkbM family methyltransferase [Nocardioides sp. SYSU D00038]|uniref:FkbM family methyltransferase n=1 Tax=Nocardioides sp. SYSU D00038 TaxID=2812554 RepID=UPI0019685055|nr:FkbM family methyltransferase [Nocardioides sp. SYSU D00038]